MKEIRALQATRTLTWVLDAVAIFSLIGIPEIHPSVFGMVLCLLVLKMITKIRIKDGFLTLLLALIATFTFGAYIVNKVPVVLAMAHGAPIFHAFLWFAAVGTRDLWLRVSVGFVELILISAMTAEFYLSISILVFSLLSSLMISCSLIRNEALPAKIDLGRPKPDREPDRDALLPKSFIIQGIVRSVALLVLTLLIFPLLPRKTGLLGGYLIPNMRVGYTENVNVTGRKAMSGAGSGEVVLRFFLPELSGDREAGRLLTSIYLGLIRARVLSEFDGVRWRAGQRWAFFPQAGLHGAAKKTTTIEAIREPMTAVIPVPYGARNVWRNLGSNFSIPERISSGEWVEQSSANSTIRFQFLIDDNDPLVGFSTGPTDEPSAADLAVHRTVSTERLKKLSEKLMPRNLPAREKVRRLSEFFVSSGFTTSLVEDANQDAIEAQLRLNSLEKFLFASKAGHCELFATASAMLLRLAGVPTRLVTGFRLSSSPSSGALVIRSGDAHAWLEYFIPEEGWRAFDPTPRSIMLPSILTYFRDFYTDLSTYWYRNVFNFDTSSSSFIGLQKIKDFKFRERFSAWKATTLDFVQDNFGFLALLAAALLALGLAGSYVVRTWFPWLLSIRARVREGPWWIKGERVRMERHLRRTLGLAIELDTAAEELGRRGDMAGQKLYRQWHDAYLAERFGPACGDLQGWREGGSKEFRRKFDAVVSQAKSARL